MKKYAYYPGCSLLSSAKEYNMSLRATFAQLGIELVELEDWNCCGAVHVDVKTPEAAITLPGRNLALAETQGFDTIVAPCSLCYKNLRTVSKSAADDKSTREQINESLEGKLAYEGDINVMHPLYLLLKEYGLDRIKDRVVKPLSKVKVASYYGCLMTRPRDVFDSSERPVGLDELMRVLGAQVIDYPMKAKCCGGALALSHAPVTARLTGEVLVSAKEADADVVALGCPMCHMALDAYQGKAENAMRQPIELPVLFFTQLLGLALGLAPERLGLKRHIVPTERIVARML